MRKNEKQPSQHQEASGGRPTDQRAGRPSQPVDSDRLQEPVYDRRLLRRLLRYGRPYALHIALAIGLIILAAFLDILGPYLTKIAVDRYIVPGNYEGLSVLVALYVGVLVASFSVRYIQVLLTQFIGQNIIYDLRQQIFNHLQRLHQQFFDRNPVGRLMTRVTSDVESLNQMFTQGIVMIFGDIFLILGIVGMMLSISTHLALWTFAVLPLLFFASFLFRKKVRAAYSQIRYWLARINAFLQERISGMSIVQLFNREAKDFQKFRDINWQHTRAYIKTIFYYALFYPAVELISATALAIIIFRGGWLIQTGGVTLGIVIAFIQYARMFFRPISDLSEKYNILQSAFASSERIFKLLDVQPAIVSPPDAFRKESLEGRIEFDNVSFAYQEELVLREVSFRIEPGMRVGVVGHTGAGKTTLIRLIGRFYDVQSGSVRVDGVDVRRWDLANLRRHMAIVLQDPFLFSGTVLENIRLGRREIPEERVKAVARLLNAHRFIEQLPGGYHFRIQERGTNLSMGQRQLISLVRALVGEPRILLLDEATANIDSESEALIQDALKQALKNRTALVIAHRLSTIQHMDQILVFHKGRLREAGTHQQLLKQRGIYFRLYQLQFQSPVAMKQSVS
ncbi:MAG: ABC transporter ATP-binding protein [Calditrichaeota bacterium]|nr:MAG: ABC transporter ATP-binding protein [Calditrichota bacterium]